MPNHATSNPATTTAAHAMGAIPNRYIEGAKCLVDEETWEFIVHDVGVQAAFDGLAASYNRLIIGRTPALLLLNSISLAYHTDVDGLSSAVVFSCDIPEHNYLDAIVPPEWISYESTVDDLRDRLSHTDIPRKKRDWSTFLSAGEACFRNDSGLWGYIDLTINTIQRYRPDLSSVHGIRFYDSFLRLSTFDTGGISDSGNLPLRTLDAWIAHVVLVYDSLWVRDKRFTYRGPGEHTARWDFETGANGGTKICVEPFYVAATAGRRTWAAFATCLHAGEDARDHDKEAEGFLKVAWQPRRGPFGLSEGQLLDKAHAGSWLPGLVRHWGWSRGDGPGTLVNVRGSPRAKEILHLASIGQPLSRCLSVMHLFKVFIDATTVIMELDKRGVLHHDISLFNLLCNPKHDPALLRAYPGKAVASVREVPCIEYILTGDEQQEPYALVTDLDMSELTKPEGVPGTVGTPMFISVEMCSPEREQLMPLSRPALDELLKKLREVESYPEMRQRMFPGGEDDGFMDFVSHIFDLEVARGTAGTTSPNAQHLPRHDVESLFWDLIWALARACPEGFDPLDSIDHEFRRFVDAMLAHDLEKETRRPYFTEARFKHILHPALRQFAPLLTNMLRYFSIPWHSHVVHGDEFLGRYHAHIAMQRLLFCEIHTITRFPFLDVRLDTEHPRLPSTKSDEPETAAQPGKGTQSETRRVSSAGDETETTAVAASAADSEASTPTAAWAEPTPDPTDTPMDDLSDTKHESQGLSKRKRLDCDDSDLEDPEPDLPLKRQKGESAPALFKPSYDTSHLADLFLRDRKFWFGAVLKTTIQVAKEAWLFPYHRLRPSKRV
ncbi:hypothetical protein AURDEDRAFT_183412 [Auricularia subglabra TFB-10046 SS5]|nr:hypothetical protein AURDEDRAFT_183412 [Auricularia subglabra TFB-10046 SS5]